MYYEFEFDNKTYHLVNNWFDGLNVYHNGSLVYRCKSDLDSSREVENLYFKIEEEEFLIRAFRKNLSVEFKVFHLSEGEFFQLSLNGKLNYFKWVRLSLSWGGSSFFSKIIFILEVFFLFFSVYLIFFGDLLEGFILLVLAVITIFKVHLKT